MPDKNLKMHYTVVCRFDKHIVVRRGQADAIARCTRIASFPLQRKRLARRLAASLVVGGTRLELVTSTMSTWRSSHLS